MPNVPRVLILSEDPVAAALVGMLCEVVSLRAAFPAEHEPPIDAMRRVRPLYAVLIDDALDVASSEIFRANAAKSGVRVLVFRPGSRTATAGAATADLVLPISIDDFAQVLGVDPPGPVRRIGDRREPAAGAAYAAEDVTASRGIIVDPAGRRWHVYDRRGADRREGAATPAIDRLFVNDDGEVRRYRIPADGPEVVAAIASDGQLVAQLALAEVVTCSSE